MTKITALVLFGAFLLFSGAAVCLAQETAQKPAAAVPPPGSGPTPGSVPPAPAAGASRSMPKAPSLTERAPATDTKPASGNPDVVVGGLPGEKLAAPEKHP